MGMLHLKVRILYNKHHNGGATCLKFPFLMKLERLCILLMIAGMGACIVYVGGCVCLFEVAAKPSVSSRSFRVFVQVRSGCAFMVHVCQDEHQLYNEFFSKPTPKLE